MHAAMTGGRFGFLLVVPAAAAAFVAAGPALAGERLDGPVAAEVVRVIDGDSLEVRARLWLGLDLTVEVRIAGIDTPEVRGKCDSERTMAAEAKRRLALLVGASVRLANVTGDKYGGRVDADVSAADGADVGAAMVANGLARPYDGGRRGDWCAVGSIR
jgi:micrococcal nuclease